jgi:hypothetical protein
MNENDDRPQQDGNAMSWLPEYKRLLFDPSAPFQAAVDLKARHLPSSLFRYYRCSDYSLDCLRHGYVWLSSPREFNDGYDSGAVVDVERCLAVSTRKDIRKIVAGHQLGLSEEDLAIVTGAEDPLRAIGAILLRREGTFDAEQVEALLDAASAARRSVCSDLHEATFEMGRFGTYVCCFSADGMLPTLWAHYADNNNGFCVEYDVAALEQSDIRRRVLLPVIYGRAPADMTAVFETTILSGGPNPLAARWPLIAASIKDRDWSYEREWRLVNTMGGGLKGIHVPMPMKAVLLGMRICESDAAKVAAGAQFHRLPVSKMAVGMNAARLRAVSAQDPTLPEASSDADPRRDGSSHMSRQGPRGVHTTGGGLSSTSPALR